MRATFFVDEPFAAGRPATLSENEANHAHVRRLGVGEQVRVVDGRGAIGEGTLVRLAKSGGLIDVERVTAVEPPPAVHLMVPIADRDRMLWLAEKAAELGVSSWRPVIWKRSRSVTPRGEGVGFQAKVRARMLAALTQSGGAWLPILYPDATLDRALAAAPTGTRLLLDAAGDAIVMRTLAVPVTVALGPEGGVEDEERASLVFAGFAPVSIAPTTLRFETAGVASLAIVRSALLAQSVPHTSPGIARA
ncbi:MAG: RsmE family RNA methyltransferase [Gemmatimonadaceae bacterium]